RCGHRVRIAHALSSSRRGRTSCSSLTQPIKRSEPPASRAARKTSKSGRRGRPRSRALNCVPMRAVALALISMSCGRIGFDPDDTFRLDRIRLVRSGDNLRMPLVDLVEGIHVDVSAWLPPSTGFAIEADIAG